MNVELVEVVTADGVRLDGALALPPSDNARSAPVDAWLLLHGTGSNFYASTLLKALTGPLLDRGGAVLRANTRGHDLVATGGGRRWLGAAFETIDDSRHDLAAWIEWLAARGFRRIGLLGHSLGAVKAIYWLAGLTAPAPVAALIAVSPPRLSHAHYLSGPRRADFLATFSQAAGHVAAGAPETLMEVSFPLTYLVSAGAYVDRYGPQEKYNVLRHAGRIPVPALFSYGSRELQTDVSFAGMPEALAALQLSSEGDSRASREVAVIAGADHVYTASEGALAAQIERWLARLR